MVQLVGESLIGNSISSETKFLLFVCEKGHYWNNWSNVNGVRLDVNIVLMSSSWFQ